MEEDTKREEEREEEDGCGERGSEEEEEEEPREDSEESVLLPLHTRTLGHPPRTLARTPLTNTRPLTLYLIRSIWEAGSRCTRFVTCNIGRQKVIDYGKQTRARISWNLEHIHWNFYFPDNLKTSALPTFYIQSSSDAQLH